MLILQTMTRNNSHQRQHCWTPAQNVTNNVENPLLSYLSICSGHINNSIDTQSVQVERVSLHNEVVPNRPNSHQWCWGSSARGEGDHIVAYLKNSQWHCLGYDLHDIFKHTIGHPHHCIRIASCNASSKWTLSFEGAVLYNQ